ncbi:hypothetical protein LSH36_27g06050 [Paralvinella palmiformis]|uniref:CABIT domain-containing protein n=1 Tax=Paralvinella palmiformis TaxID=53620 RepID=A0AAD9KAA0_9ANNE|nr:hypothetical protein LSH36_27g06050 [Paralvinella palmiformis]
MDSGYGAPIQWTEQAVHLRDFAAKHSIPNAIKVTKGQYRNIGVSKSVHSELYLHSIHTTNKVLAEAIRLKEGKTKMTVSEQKYSLPMSYKGWFELLSQDGKSVKAIQNVQELARFFPPTCLVRENIKGFVGNGGADISPERTRMVAAGEVLSLVSELWVPFPMGKGMAKRRVLKCKDSKGIFLFFGLEQKGIFSPVAGQTNISGVHSIRGLMDKFRLPLLVRLVHGVIPSKMERGFNGIFRLVNVYSDENAFVCPLRKDAKMVPISTREPLKVVTAQDYKAVLKQEELRAIQKKCIDMLDSYMNSIHILISMPDISMIKGKEDFKPKNNAIVTEPISNPDCSRVVAPPPKISKDEEDLLFEEIDGIYQYVREGGLPPKPKALQRRVQPNELNQAPKKHSHKSGHQSKTKAAEFRASPQENDDDPMMEIKMKQLDLLDEDDDDNGTTLRRQDGYSWEEPIYEPLEKIREQKRKLELRKSQDDIGAAVLLSGFDTPPGGSLCKDDLTKGPDDAVKSPSYPSRRVSTSLGDIGVPVANLRQVMRSNSCNPDNLRPKSLAIKDDYVAEDIKPVPPPIPPKRYTSCPNDVPRKTSLDTPRLTATRGKQSAGLFPNHRKSLSPTSQTTQSPLSGGHPISLASCSKYLSEGSVHASNTNLSPTQPPYIAVARVPDYHHEPSKAAVLANPDIYTKQPTSMHNGHKLHSMYL